MKKLSKRKRKEATKNYQQTIEKIRCREKICKAKVRYSTKFEADAYAKKYSDQRFVSGTVHKQRSYFCQTCNGFHLTSKV